MTTIKPNNVTAGIIIFILLISSFVTLYANFEDVYGISRDQSSCPKIQLTVPTDCVDESISVGEALENTVTLSGVEDVMESIQRFSVPGNILQRSFEVLTGAGLGIIKIFLGFTILPGQVVNILLQYYQLPAFAAGTVAVLINVYILFIMLRYILKMD